MTIREATEMARAYSENENPTEEDFFLFTEAMNYLIQEKKDPRDMLYLGGVYYEKKEFRLARKYYELAAEYEIEEAHACLGYIFYYGRTGEPDYEKAFYHFKKSMELGNIQSAYKVADMYKNGYHVAKNFEEYARIIEELWPKVKHMRNLYDPYPEIASRYAGILEKRGDEEGALELYYNAKSFLSQRIRISGFFGNFTIMKMLEADICRLMELDTDFMDFWDLYEVLKKPCEVSFGYQDDYHSVKAIQEEEGLVYQFDDSYFRTIDDLMMKAKIENKLLYTVADDLYDFEVE